MGMLTHQSHSQQTGCCMGLKSHRTREGDPSLLPLRGTWVLHNDTTGVPGSDNSTNFRENRRDTKGQSLRMELGLANPHAWETVPPHTGKPRLHENNIPTSIRGLWHITNTKPCHEVMAPKDQPLVALKPHGNIPKETQTCERGQ